MWDPAASFKGLGFRDVGAKAGAAATISATVVAATGDPAPDRVIHAVVSWFGFTPSTIRVKRGEPVVFAVESINRLHGLKIPALGVRIQAIPDQETLVLAVPDKAGHMAIVCDVFCGKGHEDMDAELILED